MHPPSELETTTEGAEPSVRVLTVGAPDAGARLDVVLARTLDISRAQCRRLLARGAVRLDGRTLAERDKGLSLAAGGRIEIESFRRPSDQVPLPEPAGGAPPPAVLACGEGWLVVDKPPGMPVHPLFEGETGTVLNAVVATHPGIVGVGEGGLRCGVVHRLDVWTSGALVVATREDAWRRLRTAFAEHRVAKRYLALVHGELEVGLDREIEVELGLVMARHRPARVRVLRPDEPPGPAVRRVSQTVRMLEAFGQTSLVEVRPRTGFLHQIRVTLAHLGHPLVGDRTYGGRRGGRREDVAADLDDLARRHMLHAAEVAIDEVHAMAPEPPDFVACRARLRELGAATTPDRDGSQRRDGPR